LRILKFFDEKEGIFNFDVLLFGKEYNKFIKSDEEGTNANVWKKKAFFFFS